ncbi:hemagglutinin repeat-containing protein [Stenotrophomonas sp. WZN-1]|uniref:hemagglutinin repeat-containing protein n=1 Tax=Stenotrophomonas sp. WZN-1 TaxID=2005046 RepID=UPI001E48D2AC|nr:hemagglutinin repeat-containing protein [Stenotrophomonas sp. WZN-1]
MSAEGNAVLLATKDIVFDVAHNTERSDSSSRGKGWGFANNTSGLPFGTNNSQSQGSGSSDTITGTQLSVGGGVRMATTEGNISLTAANIAAEKDVSIRAAGDLLVRSGQDTVSNANTSDSKAIGTVQISDTEKFSGWHREQHQDDSAQVSQVASSIGSLGGSVNLTAGGKYTQTASNVVAAKDVNITAAEIELLTADESGHYSQSDKDLKIGVFARVKSPLIDLINNVDAARQSDDRLQKMQGMAAGANAYQAASAISALSGRGGSGELFRAEAGIGFKTANSSADGSSMVSRGSTIQGGGNVNLTSTQGDIHVVQGNLSAGNTLSLDSAGDILLEAGKAHVADRSKSSNAGAEVGVGVSVGAQTGVYVYAEASVGSSKANAESSTWQNTTLTGKNISMKAEGDTTLRGATATADRIDVKTGGTLTIESLQDIAESMSKNSQVGGRVQVSLGTAWNADGYASAGKASGSYQGVGQQSGLFAGNGGYHVDAGHVNLVGGAIASTHAGNSELTADSLTFTDLQNHMDYTASSGSISGGAGGQMDGWTPKPGTAAPRGGPGLPMMEKGSDSSSTFATLTEGNITIGGKQTSAAELGINTDASGAHRALDALPDASKLLADQQAMAAAAGTVMATSQQIAWDVQAYQSKKATQAYYDGLSTDDKKAFNALSAAQRDKVLTANSQAYNDAKKWGDGGEYSRALSAVTTAVVGGVAGQGVGQVASNALAPYAAYFIGSKLDPNHGSDPNATLQLLSHAVLGALLAEANGGSAGTGAASAAGGELAAKVLTNTLTGGDPSKLSQEQKEMVLALSQAVGALASGLPGQELAGIALNAGIAKNSVENNFLAEDQARVMKQQLDECGSDTSCQKTVRDVAKQLSERMDYELLSVCTANSASPACQAFVNAAVSYKYGSWPGELGLFDDLGRSSEALSSFAHSLNGRAYRELIFENGGLQPVYILPQEHTVAALAEWTGNLDRTIDQYGLFSKESSAELGLGLAKVLFRKYGAVTIIGGNGGFGAGSSAPSGTQVGIAPTSPEAPRGHLNDLTSIENKQLDKKFKHAEDFGLVTSKKNPQTIAQYESAIRNHMAAPETGLRGTYGFVPGSKVYFNSSTNNAVVLDSSGKFVTGFKLDPKSSQYENLFKNGVLR